MISLTFSSGPWGPKCLKYQNVPHLGSFWAIGKPWERFQRWDIIIYFIPVPNDHTVAPRCRCQEDVLSGLFCATFFQADQLDSSQHKLGLPRLFNLEYLVGVCILHNGICVQIKNDTHVPVAKLTSTKSMDHETTTSNLVKNFQSTRNPLSAVRDRHSAQQHPQTVTLVVSWQNWFKSHSISSR